MKNEYSKIINSPTLLWYELPIWKLFGWMIKRRGYKFMDGIVDLDGITAFVFSTIKIEREYKMPDINDAPFMDGHIKEMDCRCRST